MAGKRVGRHTIRFDAPPHIVSAFTLVGQKEGAGPLGKYFDGIVDDDMMGETTPEKAERKFMLAAAEKAVVQAGLRTEDIDYFLAGDLLNQIVSATFTARNLDMPYLGIFAACATSAEALGLGAALIDGGFADRVLVAASSHYQSAERQYRYPVELNIQRKVTNQWTFTGAGAAVLSREGQGPRITHWTVGRVVDYGLKDANDMGCAMAPAAADTVLRHLQDMEATPGDYDLILTGDLASQGQKMFRILVKEAGVTMGGKHEDCGAQMYTAKQQAGAGGSGAACSMSGILGYAVKEVNNGRFRRVLALPTGCLHSPLTYQQGDSCPGVCHALVIEA